MKRTEIEMQNECQQILPLPAFKQKQPFWKKQNHMFMALPKPPIEIGCTYIMWETYVH